MPRQNTKPADYPQAVLQQIELLAQNIVIARKRRRETQAQWARKLGVSQPTMARIERGDPSVAMASYVMCMWLINQSANLADLIAPLNDHTALEREVNTFIGSKDDGNTFPGASAPFGMIQVSPIGSHYSGWRYDDPQIRGFGHSFLSGAGCWEQGGQVSVLPVTGRIGPGGDFDTADPKAFDHKRYGSRYRHDGENGQAEIEVEHLEGRHCGKLRAHRGGFDASAPVRAACCDRSRGPAAPCRWESSA